MGGGSSKKKIPKLTKEDFDRVLKRVSIGLICCVKTKGSPDSAIDG